MLIPQEPVAALDPVMRVRRQMALADIDDARIDAALAAVDLGPAARDAFGFELSGGMAQRVVVATALGTGAPIVIADEPTKCLDPDRAGQVIALLRRLLAEGRSLVVITHDRRVAEAMPGQLAVLDGGRFVEQDDNRRVLAAPRSVFAREWLAADPARWTPCARNCDRAAAALSAHGLAFAWPGRAPLFRDLDLHLPRGAVLGLRGPSGCGKTTLAMSCSV
jgi:peptide/nickel transport system ATP-binding protein